jgi:hypothetical protein
MTILLFNECLKNLANGEIKILLKNNPASLIYSMIKKSTPDLYDSRVWSAYGFSFPKHVKDAFFTGIVSEHFEKTQLFFKYQHWK